MHDDNFRLLLHQSRPSPARIYDFMLGGKDNYPADRELAADMLNVVPDLRAMARANRDFLRRAVIYLVAEAGITQFLDVGSGLPAMDNVHEVAQRVDPAAHVMYVDNDPVVAAHARALLTTVSDPRTAFVTADATDPASILAAPELTRTLDLSRPVALMLVSFLMYFEDQVAENMVSTLLGALAPGSVVVISHPTADFAEDEGERTSLDEAAALAEAGGITYLTRTREQVQHLLAGTQPVPPGLVPMPRWRPEQHNLTTIANGYEPTLHYWVGVGRVTEPTATTGAWASAPD